jgi:sec-independent protein translocase protein TatC
MARVRAISHEDELTLVEHLDELRARVVVSIAVFGVALALCFWQNHLLLQLASGPLPSDHDRLITFGISEPFTTTVTVSAYAAIILALPIVLYQAYAYLLPAFSRQQQRAIMPLLLLIPALFVAGIVFGYLVVLPAATRFLLNFNDAQFNIQVRAKDYYGFFAQTLIACGVVFQMPVAILAVTRLGIVRVEQLTHNRRYAYLVCAVLAAALPGVDPVSMLLETAPLILLYELSIILARLFGSPSPAPRPRSSPAADHG